ncbi:glycerol kinase 3-like isoform X1 [Onthophagus taurus]|uniref:glycerol kinase 3-like isoform X1 n=1 Tax=Onthophagus taurus TaxID=166361 RepID=UPI0039BDD259
MSYQNMKSEKKDFGPLVGAIDEGTSSTRFMVFAAKTAEVITYHQVNIPSITPFEGWVEQDAELILKAIIETIDVTCDNLQKLDVSKEDIVAIGITNQRETTVLWDSQTGKPLYNALVWLDMRTSDTVDKVLDNGYRRKSFLKTYCGLPVSTYFSALKIRWLMDNVEEVRKAIEEQRCLFGTIDTWIIWNLTGGVVSGLHITDVTNASRTMLMNIETLKWDTFLCDTFDIPIEILPQIKSSAEIYGYLTETLLKGVPISGCLGDQQAALVGQKCFLKGQAKNTYGTGCFLLYNTGTSLVQSTHGLLTTVGYKLGPKAPTIYALEGAIAIAGKKLFLSTQFSHLIHLGVALQWLRDNLNVLKSTPESNEIAQSAGSRGEIYFVPAFSGLYAPYWRKDARSVMCGLTESTKPGHIVKAALEAVAFQVRDILEAMSLDSGYKIKKLLVNGGMTANNFLMQVQADYSGVPVVRPVMAETTALGAAMAAGYADGINVWDFATMLDIPSDTFMPKMTNKMRNERYYYWKMAIARSLNWHDDLDKDDTDLPTLPALSSMNIKEKGKGQEEESLPEVSTFTVTMFIISYITLLVAANYISKRP